MAVHGKGLVDNADIAALKEKVEVIISRLLLRRRRSSARDAPALETLERWSAGALESMSAGGKIFTKLF